MNFIAGEVLFFNKPLHKTSFQLVSKLRYELCKKLGVKKLKVGHAGTLDPLATGVMIICTGKKTKDIETFQYQVKEYIATLKLGETTPSFDQETEVDQVRDISSLTEQEVREAIAKFTGEIWQVPPVYSAVKVEGKRAYEFARSGETVELKPKLLVIDEIEVQSIDFPYVTIRVVCSKGTYIRALARDIGEALNVGAHLTKLERTRVGDVCLSQCIMGDDETIKAFVDAIQISK